MGSENKSKPVRVDSGMGVIWFIGWLFTIGYVQLAWWKIILGIVVWPYFLGVHVR
ncbi:MAG: hypothetical protein PHV74_04345 [Dehalococcoidia bacterium]|nr:hypothetical protein [Dehalococcoidia bacterium]